jgi:hypothetical protein
MDIAAPCDEAQVTREQLEVSAASETSETQRQKVLSQSQFENTPKKLNFAAKKRGGRDKEHNNRRFVKVQWLECDK